MGTITKSKFVLGNEYSLMVKDKTKFGVRIRCAANGGEQDMLVDGRFAGAQRHLKTTEASQDNIGISRHQQTMAYMDSNQNAGCQSIPKRGERIPTWKVSIDCNTLPKESTF